MSEKPKALQMDAPGIPASDVRFYEAKVDEAVILVEEAERNLRSARKAERVARGAAAEARKRLSGQG